MIHITVFRIDLCSEDENDCDMQGLANKGKNKN
jgi:hypothetical protein